LLRAVIFANGNLARPAHPLAGLHSADLIIAADGGAHHCRAMGLAPDVLIGDLDSITKALQEDLSRSGTQVILYPRDKDETDLELALRYAVDQNAEEILLLGILGGRLDQTLANLLLLSRPEWQPARLMVADGPDFALLVRAGSPLTLQTQTGDIVSLIPLSRTVTGVSTEGLRWSLKDATLEFGNTLGISNETTGDIARVEIKTGQLLAVHREQERRKK
jgi:thiamine pyrophosphokinase